MALVQQSKANRTFGSLAVQSQQDFWQCRNPKPTGHFWSSSSNLRVSVVIQSQQDTFGVRVEIQSPSITFAVHVAIQGPSITFGVRAEIQNPSITFGVRTVFARMLDQSKAQRTLALVQEPVANRIISTRLATTSSLCKR